IKTVSDLRDINNYLGEKHSRYTFELKNDIDLDGEDWIPIGYDNNNSFRGTFKGNGHSILNLTIEGASGSDFIKSVNYSNVGLFGYIYNAEVTDLTLSVNISFFAEQNYMHIGALVGYAYGENTIKNITVNGDINIGTTFELVPKENDYLEECAQTQYFGGVIGYSSGKLIVEDIDIDINLDNLIGSRGYQFEKDAHGEYTDEKYIEIFTDNAEPNFFPEQTFIGGLAGLVRGDGSSLRNINSGVNIPMAYGNSVYCGGVIGAGYQTDITNAYFDGVIGTKVYIKGVLGGIAGLLDEGALVNSTVKDATMWLNVTKQEYEAYSAGGLAGYVNDFSSIGSSLVENTKIISTLPNRIYGKEYNYPAIGGFAGTIRDSALHSCTADGGGVYKNPTTLADKDYMYSAGMVAEVIGNSQLANCSTSFYAYQGVAASYSETIYVDENGKRVLRYIKSGYPNVYVDIRAYIKDNILYIDLLDDAQELMGTYSYKNFTPNGVEEYSEYYYKRAMGGEGSLVDEDGKVIVEGGRVFQDYERLTGLYSFNELEYYYYEDTDMVVGADDIDHPNKEGWKTFVAKEPEEWYD
ncbi:MAG: hypothetical protein WBM21_03690, partial [Christensenellales bacterium]